MSQAAVIAIAIGFVAVVVMLVIARVWARSVALHVANQEALEAAKAFQLAVIKQAAAKKQQAEDQAEKDKAAVLEMDNAELERKVNE